MKIEEQVVSLELAQQLKDAGYPQDDSYFMWADAPFAGIVLENYEGNPHSIAAAAPTVAELGEQLLISKRINLIKFYKTILGFSCVAMGVNINNERKGIPSDSIGLEADTEANARAKMWLYLKKEGLL